MLIKIFQGDYNTIQKDIDTWIDVYKPEIKDLRQSMLAVEHNVLILITVLYETTEESKKVEYKIKK